MYSFTLNKKAYKIPSLASELELGQFMDIGALRPDDEIGMLSILMGETPEINVKDAKEADIIGRELKSIYALIDQLKVDLERCLNSGLLLLPPTRIEILGLNLEIKKGFVGSLPYWGYVHTRNVITKRIKEGKNEQFNATFDIAGILAHNLYTLVTRSAYNEQKAEEFIEVVKKANFIEAMQLGNFFFDSAEKAMGVEAQTLDYAPESLEIEAGVEVFNKYGPINTLETLAGGDILRWEEVKGLSYDTVYIKLLINKDKREFEKRYREVIRANAEADKK